MFSRYTANSLREWGVQHVYPGGYLVHHLFLGVLIELPAAFILALGTRNRVLAFLAPAALGKLRRVEQTENNGKLCTAAISFGTRIHCSTRRRTGVPFYRAKGYVELEFSCATV